MKKDIMVLSVMTLIILDSGTALSAKDNIWEEIGRGYLNLNTVLVDADNPDTVYIGTNNAIFKSEDGAQSY